jgi:phosphorylated adapter RNA export protein
MEPLTAERLAEILHEPKRFLLQRVLRTVGQDTVADVLVATLQCEANGGMLTKDGTRRRTPGGTFLTLMKERVTKQQRWRLFPPSSAYLRQQAPKGP